MIQHDWWFVESLEPGGTRWWDVGHSFRGAPYRMESALRVASLDKAMIGHETYVYRLRHADTPDRIVMLG